VLDPRAAGAASVLIGSLRDDVARFVGDGNREDDLTVVAVQVLEPPATTGVPRSDDVPATASAEVGEPARVES
jgi:hypothetical protein